MTHSGRGCDDLGGQRNGGASRCSTEGEDGDVYAALYAEAEARLKDDWDQMMVADITNHFWEQQRYRRCSGAIVNSKRRAALVTILRDVGLNPRDAGRVANIYFDVARWGERFSRRI